MAVEYRNMLPEDEDAVFDLRIRMWGGPSREYARQGAYLDPLFSRHTFVAVDEHQTLLSCLRYYPRDIRDSQGMPQKVSCVASVVTIEAARRQGHAQKLMQLALEAMREERCKWSLLLSSDMAVPLYEGLGYRVRSAPFYKGLLSSGLPRNKGTYSVQRIEPPFHVGDENWQAVRGIYAAYNEQRPLSIVRDESYWRGYFARRLASFLKTNEMALLVARAGGGRAVGYLLMYLPKQDEANQGGHFTISELCIMPGHNEAVTALLSAAKRWVNEVMQVLGDDTGQVSGVALLPREEQIEQAMQIMFGETLHLVDDRTMMARPVNDDFTHDDLQAMFAAPSALFWMMDDF